MELSHNPRLSIGLPVYNGERFLAQAIESLLAQTYGDFRLIISDNASTDRTQDLCRYYASRDARIVYERTTENRGAVWNLNRVVRLADSELFKWAAHDDICEPQFVERCVDVLDRRPNVVLCYTQSHIIDENGDIVSACTSRVNAAAATPGERFHSVMRYLTLTHMLFGVMRLEVLRRTRLHGRYPTADMTLVAELALRGELFEVAEPLFFRREHPGQPHRVHRTAAEFANWLDPGGNRPIRFVWWTQLVDHLRTIAQAPISLDQKLRCCASFTMFGLPRRWWRSLLRAA